MPIALGIGVAGQSPEITIQIAFTTDPNSPGASSPTWTTIRNRVLSVDCSRSGRTNELELYQAGEAQLAIRNSNGEFDPMNPAGPYYGFLLPFRPIRILATYAGVDYPLWQGYVKAWPQTWADPILGQTNLACIDALGLLNLIALDSALAAEVLSADPLVFYPLSESGGTTAGNQSGHAYSPAQIVHTKAVNTTTPGTYQFGGTLDVPGSANSSGLQFTGTNNNGGVGLEDGNVLTLPRVSLPWTSWTIELWCQIPRTPSQHGVIFQAIDSQHFTPLTGTIGTDPPGKISLYQTGATSSVRIVPPDAFTYLDTPINFNLADNKVHHVAVTYQAPFTSGAFVTATMTVYVDGAQILTSTFDTASTAVVSEFIQLGGVAVNAQTLPGAPLTDGAPLIGTVSNLAIYDQTLPIATVQGHYFAGLGFPGELSGWRAQRILAYGGWQPALQQLQQGRSTMGPASGLSGTALLSALQDVSDTELGTLTVTADGLVDFRSRDDRLLKATASFVFGDNTAAQEIPYNVGLTFDFDPTLLFNDVQVTRQNGPVAESADLTSIQRFFPSVKQLTMNLDTDDQARQAADFVLAREKDPHLRLEALTVNAGGIDGTTLPYVWPALLRMDLHDRVGIRHRPMGAPAISLDGFVEQLSHHIDGRKESAAWDVTVQVSPAFDMYAIWDDTGSLWDSAIWAF